MMSFIKSIALALTLALGSQAMARDTVVALSHAQSTESLKAQTERVLVHLLGSMQPGERAWFYDATHSQLIGTFDVPGTAVSVVPKRVLVHNKATIAKIGQFVRSAQPVLTHPNRINLPQLLRSVRENVPAGENGADLIILGHPLHMPGNVPSQSMLGGRVPSDGHIAANPGQSIYGTSGLAGSLAGYDVYFAMLADSWAVSPPYAHHVTRFWTLSVEAHGANMAYIGSDLETLFARAGRDVTERAHEEPLRPDEKLEMLTFAADDGQIPDIYRRPLEVVFLGRRIIDQALVPRCTDEDYYRSMEQLRADFSRQAKQRIRKVKVYKSASRRKRAVAEELSNLIHLLGGSIVDQGSECEWLNVRFHHQRILLEIGTESFVPPPSKPANAAATQNSAKRLLVKLLKGSNPKAVAASWSDNETDLIERLIPEIAAEVVVLAEIQQQEAARVREQYILQREASELQRSEERRQEQLKAAEAAKAMRVNMLLRHAQEIEQAHALRKMIDHINAAYGNTLDRRVDEWRALVMSEIKRLDPVQGERFLEVLNQQELQISDCEPPEANTSKHAA